MIQEGIAVDPLLAECELEAHDFGQAQLDMWQSHLKLQAKKCLFKEQVDMFKCSIRKSVSALALINGMLTSIQHTTCV